MKVTVAKSAGFCYGVRRAVNMAVEASKSEKIPIYSAGSLIHNQLVVSELENMGILTAEDLRDIEPHSTVIVRAHGLQKNEIEKLCQKNCKIIDATCPHVSKIHSIVTSESAKNRHILIVGKRDHPEVQGIASRCGDFSIVESAEKLDDFLVNFKEKPISVVCQTTFSVKNYNQIVNKLKKACNCIHIFDTICIATDERQNEALKFASKSDAVIVIGDRHSSNSKNLFELCDNLCGKTVFVESASEIPSGFADGVEHLFITAGASTPDLIIKEVSRNMTDEIKNTEEQSFEELLEQSLKTLHTGEKVTGIITQISNTDVHVDLGVKQAGYIPTTELSDDPAYVVADNIKVGDEIEAIVVRVNDVEGMITLSKKRLDAGKNWEKMEAAVDSREIVQGVVVDQNKGGVVAMVMGIRVFIPASQTGLPREADLEQIVKTTQKMRITEVNRQRRRVVGSIKAVTNDVRKEAAAKIWETLEVGQKFKGIVKSFTTYGAFIDIGGVDGMVHISELSWSRVKHPSDVLKIGETVDVYVIALDQEKKKISLGYRDASTNPWNKFITAYSVGDVANVKIVKFMPFGAFAEVLPGVDGLIHISQIADRRIGKPDEVLTVGQEVDAKITEIDTEKKKISLSIRALLETPAMSHEEKEEDIQPDVEETEDDLQ